VFGSLFAVGSFLFIVPLVSLSFTLLSSLKLPTFQVIVVALLVGLVGFTVAGKLSDRFGRKRTTYLFLAISLVFSFLFFLGVPAVVEASIISLMFGSAFFAYFGIWMSEIFPAEVRATGTNMVFFLGRLIGGGFGVTIVLLLPLGLQMDLGLALVISSLVVGLSVLNLPETARKA
jgi:MFS family permease